MACQIVWRITCQIACQTAYKVACRVACHIVSLPNSLPNISQYRLLDRLPTSLTDRPPNSLLYILEVSLPVIACHVACRPICDQCLGHRLLVGHDSGPKLDLRSNSKSNCLIELGRAGPGIHAVSTVGKALAFGEKVALSIPLSKGLALSKIVSEVLALTKHTAK